MSWKEEINVDKMMRLEQVERKTEEDVKKTNGVG